ncbi:hypothetical protein [Croceimicrobium sp.]|uniref:hypothetical protein n=1 Tax=Croceimicrobium sp. TaxID=2828340 RepID=UPI003BA9074A
MIKARIFLLCLSLGLLSCKKEEETSYLEKYTGTYIGGGLVGGGNVITGSSYKYSDAIVKISKGSGDSSLNFRIDYDSRDVYILKDIKIHSSGEGLYDWDGGSLYGYLEYHFDGDSLHFTHNQNAGQGAWNRRYFDGRR